MASDEERFARAVDRFNKAGIGGAALGLPVVVMAALGAGQTVMLVYLVVVTVVLAVLVAAQRIRGRLWR